MRRHPGLHPLSQHHHFALIQALELRRATAVPADGRAAALHEAAQTFLGFWKKAGQQHFREEEEILLIAYARYVRLEQDPLVLRLLIEHVEIGAQIEKLEAALAAGPPGQDAVAALARALHDHVRFEENEFFPRVESVIEEGELAQLGRRFTRLHPGESCEV